METEYITRFGSPVEGIAIFIKIVEFFRSQIEKRNKKKLTLSFKVSGLGRKEEVVTLPKYEILANYYFSLFILNLNDNSFIISDTNKIVLKFKSEPPFSLKIMNPGNQHFRGNIVMKKEKERVFEVRVPPFEENKEFLLKTAFKISVTNITGKTITSPYLLLKYDPSADISVNVYDLRF